jgi:hypothetical protein
MSASPPRSENLFVNLACNLALPTAIMTWGSGERALGPKWGLVVALLFPVGYGVHDFLRRRRFNFISAVGFTSVLLTGGLALLKVDPFWLAVKDGLLPLLVGVAVLVSNYTKEPLVQEMLFNPQVLDTVRVEAALAARGVEPAFQALLRQASRLVAFALMASGVINFFLARWIIRSPMGTDASNHEIAKMHWASLLGLIPTMAVLLYALWRLLQGTAALTGLTVDQILRAEPEQQKAERLKD